MSKLALWLELWLPDEGVHVHEQPLVDCNVFFGVDIPRHVLVHGLPPAVNALCTNEQNTSRFSDALDEHVFVVHHMFRRDFQHAAA